MFKTLPKTDKVRSKMMKQFYDNLPESFQRKDAITLGAQLNIKERTVDKYLKNLSEGHFLVNDEKNYGNYIKV
jgi:Fic family protein